MARYAFVTSPNVTTLILCKDLKFDTQCFAMRNEQKNQDDPLPDPPSYNLKHFYLDGKRISYNLLLKDSEVCEWAKENFYSLFRNTGVANEMVEEKTVRIFKQMDIPYYGPGNDKIGTLTPTEEFYILLKIHNYMSQFYYDYTDGTQYSFLFGGQLQCDGYAELTMYLLECAGVEAKTLKWNNYEWKVPGYHYWNSTRIGDEWFECDEGWDCQGGHLYYWSFLSSSRIKAQTGDDSHNYDFAFDTYHTRDEADKTERVIAKRTLGDIDGDDIRNNNDVDILWAYVKGESDDINMKNADINFDGDVDVTDAVLLDNFVNGKVIEHSMQPDDATPLAVRIAFLNGDDYDNIKYLYTDRRGYITLPDDLFEAPEGKKISYDVGEAGEAVRISTPLTVVRVKWIDETEPDSSKTDPSSLADSSKPDLSSRPDSSEPDKTEGKLGDVNNDGKIDIEDAVLTIGHVNGVKALNADEKQRADVDHNGKIDIEDAVKIIAYINGTNKF